MLAHYSLSGRWVSHFFFPLATDEFKDQLDVAEKKATKHISFGLLKTTSISLPSTLANAAHRESTSGTTPALVSVLPKSDQLVLYRVKRPRRTGERVQVSLPHPRELAQVTGGG